MHDRKLDQGVDEGEPLDEEFVADQPAGEADPLDVVVPERVKSMRRLGACSLEDGLPVSLELPEHTNDL